MPSISHPDVGQKFCCPNVPEKDVIYENLWYEIMEDLIGIPLVCVEANDLYVKLEDPTDHICFWFSRDWVVRIKPVDNRPTCQCQIWIENCHCGRFKSDMENKGLKFNNVTKEWVKVWD